jgi:flavin reductase (DIM6/NTAB) family NADH-FMN oxidoreductase RutF
VTVDRTLFRSVLAQWPSGVSVVTTLAEADGDPAGPNGATPAFGPERTPRRRPHGMTASSFSSVSLDPPLVSVCLGNHLPSRSLVEQAGVFAISFLGKDQADLGQRFAGMQPGVTDRFAGGNWITAATGCPVLGDATGWLDCKVVHAYPGGDHTIFVGEVIAAGTPRISAPLLFHSRAWGQLADPLPEGIVMSVLDHPAGGLPPAALADLGAAVTGAGGIAVTVGDPSELSRVGAARSAALELGLPLIAYVADAFEPSREATVLATLDALATLAATGPGELEIGCVETAEASPLQVRRVLQDAVVRVRPANLRVRLRAHHGLGLVNALVAMKSGVRHFDTVREGAGGGLTATDLLLLSRQLGITCSTTAELAFEPSSARE